MSRADVIPRIQHVHGRVGSAQSPQVMPSLPVDGSGPPAAAGDVDSRRFFERVWSRVWDEQFARGAERVTLTPGTARVYGGVMLEAGSWWRRTVLALIFCSAVAPTVCVRRMIHGTQTDVHSQLRDSTLLETSREQVGTLCNYLTADPRVFVVHSCRVRTVSLCPAWDQRCDAGGECGLRGQQTTHPL